MKRPAFALAPASLLSALTLFLLLILASGHALAHKGSDAYLDVQQAAVAQADAAGATPVRLQLSVALRDLDQIVAIDANGDARLTWGEVKRAMPALLEILDLHANTPAARDADASAPRSCRLAWQADGLERRSDGSYLRAVAVADCPRADGLQLHYTLFREQDATHRLLVGGRIDGADLLTTTSPQDTAALVLRAAAGSAVSSASPTALPAVGAKAALTSYFMLGMAHLLQGYDHLAFLLALVLPLQLVLGRRSGNTVAGTRQQHSAPSAAGATWWALLRTVTAFTLGHSVTLAMATLGWTQASPAWVEPLIALSIGITAWLNLRPLPWLRSEWLALGFGMVHGYGFAGLLVEAAAPPGLLPWALAGFNLGVEAGQLLAVAAWVLLVQLVVRQRWYHGVVVRGGSALLMAASTLWFVQRVS